jgi:hypothetical protein
MSGVIPLLPAYIFKACAGTTLRVPLPKVVFVKRFLPNDVILQLCTLPTSSPYVLFVHLRLISIVTLGEGQIKPRCLSVRILANT